MNHNCHCGQSGMALVFCLIFLAVVTCLALTAMENNVLNQKMSGTLQAGVTALNSAEAGLMAEEAKINGQNTDLSTFPGKIEYQISGDTVDDCQQHIFTILSTATYQNARIRLVSAYLKARQPPLPGCPNNQISHRLWWQQQDIL
jgi:Tfp pilus assembly protein PilX